MSDGGEITRGRDPEQVRSMFDRIAGRYDLANHLLSGGFDFYWRGAAARMVERWQPQHVLDLATGSGDLALALQKRLPAADIIGADFSEEMLARARAKGLAKTIVADALALPFPGGRFDAVTVAFGLRNMADYGAALREMARVLRPGGHLLVLEFSIPGPPLSTPYRWYLHRVLPRIAHGVSGQKAAYDYLGTSIEGFPQGRAMTALMEANGFSEAAARALTAGIVTIYTASRQGSG